MPSYQPPKRGVAYITYVSLSSQADVKLFQVNPTLAAGDVKVSTDGGAFVNIATLPTVTPAAGKSVKVSLSAAEMGGDNIVVLFSDAAGAEWCDFKLELQTASSQIDDLGAVKNVVDQINIFAGGEILARLSTAGVADIVNVVPTIANVALILSRLGIPVTTSISGDIAAIVAGGLTILQDTRLAAIAASILNPAGFKKNTAVPNFDFPMRDTLGNLRINPTNLTASRRINNGTYDPCTNTPIYVTKGMCTIDLSASDMNGDKVTFIFEAQNCRPTIITLYPEP